jgi:enoyl-CoA hydratase/carnithine racemase
MSQECSSEEMVLVRSDRNSIAYLTLNRPNYLNCLSEALLTSLELEFNRINHDKSVKCVVLAANGRAFCAGHDLREMQSKSSSDYYRWLFTLCSRMMQAISNISVPVIAKVHGDATAAGCQLVAACDIAIASSSVRFAAAGINLGSFCATPAVAITRKLPVKSAFEMLFTGRFINAETAEKLGLINYSVAPNELDIAVENIATEIASKSRAALSFGKSQFYTQRQMSLKEAYSFATEALACNLVEEDAIEGIDAFLNKRKPQWKS